MSGLALGRDRDGSGLCGTGRAAAFPTGAIAPLHGTGPGARPSARLAGAPVSSTQPCVQPARSPHTSLQNGESSNGRRPDHRRSSSESSQPEVEKKLQQYAYPGRGHKADYLFKHLPDPEQSLEASK